MSRTWVIVILALAAIAVVVFLARDNVSDLDDPDLWDRDGVEGSSDPRAEPGTKGSTAAAGTEARRPTLFGRAHVRIGVGDAIGRLQDYITKQPVAGATVRLTGTGYGGETVAVTAESGTDGRFQLQAIPAGQDLELVILVKEKKARTLSGLVVSARRVEDLGTIWLGDAGTLEGRVLGMSGEGIKGADVQVLQGKFTQEEMMQDFFGFLSKLDHDPVPVARGVSDDAGRFRIDGVPPGPITVVARAPNHHHAIKATAMTKDGAVGGPITLRVTEAEPIVGRVVTEDGRGLEGARIAFMNQQDDENGFIGRHFVETSSDGSFRAESPPPARQLIAIVAAEGFPTLFSEVGSDRSALEFMLVGGSRLTLRFVHDDSGDPIPDAAIVAMLAESQDMGNSGTIVTGLTDASGRVEFAARPGFVNMIVFQHGDYGSSLYSPQLRGFGVGAELALKGPPQLEIKAGDNEAELRKPRGVIVRGMVTDESGRPLAGVTVKTSGGSFGLGGQLKTLTDEMGTYRLAATGEESLGISVEAPGFVQDPKSRIVSFVKGTVEVEHDVAMLQAARVEGKVLGTASSPVAGVEVRLRGTGGDERPGGDWGGVMTGSTETAITDGRGRFTIEDVAPGNEYHLIGRAQGYVVTRSEDFRVEKGGLTVRAPILKLKQGISVEVEVRDPYGEAVQGAHVEVKIEPKAKLYWDQSWRWRPYASLMTTATGTVSVQDLPDGKVTFTARADGAAPAQLEIQVSSASPPTAPVEVRLRPAITVSGTVVDQHGDPVKNGSISVAPISPPDREGRRGSTDWISHQSTHTSRLGRFELRGVPADVPVTLSFNADGYRHKSLTLEERPDNLQLVVHKIDPEVHRRVQVLTAELMDLYGRLQNAQDDGEQTALQQEIQEIRREISALNGEQSGVRMAEAAPAIEQD